MRAAQLYLTYLGYPPGGVDGWFGKRTQTAIIKFQKDKTIPATGFLDSKSYETLEQAAMRWIMPFYDGLSPNMHAIDWQLL